MRALFAVAVACLVFGALADHVPYKYTIDLEQPPEKRYYPVVYDMCRDEYHIGAFRKLLVALDSTLIAKMAEAAGGREVLFMFADSIFKTRMPEVAKELQGISHYFGKYCKLDIPSGELAIMQLIYQIAMPIIVGDNTRRSDRAAGNVLDEILYNFGMACTSLVAANSTGHVIHGRNLDWLNAGMYAPLTTELTFTRGGEVVAVTTSFFPELSPTTLVSPALAFSYNARTVELQQDYQCLAKLGHDFEPFQLRIRNEVISGKNYSQIYDQLSNADFCAPAYIAISGPGKFEGALFTTHISKKPEVKAVNTANEDPDDPRDTWFVVVSNDDIEYSNRAKWSERYNFTLELLANQEQDVFTASIDNIESEVLNVTGVKRDGYTCYMGVMDTRAFEYKFVVRSNITDDEFSQNSNIPSESSSVLPQSTSSESSFSGSAKLSVSPVVLALFAVFAAIMSRF